MTCLQKRSRMSLVRLAYDIPRIQIQFAFFLILLNGDIRERRPGLLVASLCSSIHVAGILPV